MESASFGLGWVELLILVVISGLLPLIVLGVVLFIVLRSKAQAAGRVWSPDAVGQPSRVRLLGMEDRPIATSARWENGELTVTSDEWASKSLFDVPLDQLDQCMLTYRFRIKSENLARAVYPEMWCRIPERGQFFSRGLHCKVRGTNNWTTVEIPFYLQAGQRADLLHLNLVFEGAGTVRLKDIEVLMSPAKCVGS
jgi:hypothetical protein